MNCTLCPGPRGCARAPYFPRNVDYHYDKHHRGYGTDKLNELIPGSEFDAQPYPRRHRNARLREIFNSAGLRSYRSIGNACLRRRRPDKDELGRGNNLSIQILLPTFKEVQPRRRTHVWFRRLARARQKRFACSIVSTPFAPLPRWRTVRRGAHLRRMNMPPHRAAT